MNGPEIGALGENRASHPMESDASKFRKEKVMAGKIKEAQAIYLLIKALITMRKWKPKPNWLVRLRSSSKIKSSHRKKMEKYWELTSHVITVLPVVN